MTLLFSLKYRRITFYSVLPWIVIRNTRTPLWDPWSRTNNRWSHIPNILKWLEVVWKRHVAVILSCIAVRFNGKIYRYIKTSRILNQNYQATRVIVRKRSTWVEIDEFLSWATLKFIGWHWKTIGHLFYTTLRFAHHFKQSVKSNLRYSPETLNSVPNRQFFVTCDLEIWQMTLKNNKAPLLCSFKLCASFHSHWWIQTGVQKRSISFKIDDFLFVWPFHLTNDLENNRAPFLYYIKLCASFQSHGLIQSGITVRKLSILVNIGIFFGPCDLQI